MGGCSYLSNNGKTDNWELPFLTPQSVEAFHMHKDDSRMELNICTGYLPRTTISQQEETVFSWRTDEDCVEIFSKCSTDMFYTLMSILSKMGCSVAKPTNYIDREKKIQLNCAPVANGSVVGLLLMAEYDTVLGDLKELRLVLRDRTLFTITKYRNEDMLLSNDAKAQYQICYKDTTHQQRIIPFNLSLL
jgi:hypothetical protein